jgi:hypothetical protein
MAAVNTSEVGAVLMPFSIAPQRQTTKLFLFGICNWQIYTCSTYQILPLYKHFYKLRRKHSFVYAKWQSGNGTDISLYDFTVTCKEEKIKALVCHTC